MIEINVNKSAVLELRVDARTPRTLAQSYRNIPILKEYKYLGLVITDDLKFKENIETQKEREKNLGKISWILSNKKLDGLTRWHTFQALFRSKVSYAANLIVAIS